MSYDCLECPGYCCTYDFINVYADDVRRIAKRFKISEKKARQRFTKESKYGRVLRMKEDPAYGRACVFLHSTRRICTIYNHRPKVCRDYPHGTRCGYWDYLVWERRHQGSPEIIPSPIFVELK
jgi:Fe-S-cluster containining protein